MAPMAVVGAQGAEYVESDEMLLRVCSGKSLSLAKVVEAAACDAASGTYTDDQGRLALHHACAHDQVTVEILAATPGDRFAKDISGDAPVDLLCREPGRDRRRARVVPRGPRRPRWTPLHYLCANAGAPPAAVAALAAFAPAAALATDDEEGMAPAHALALSDALLWSRLRRRAGRSRGRRRAARRRRRGPAPGLLRGEARPRAAAAFDADGADGRRRRRELRDDGFTVVRVGERAAAELARETSAVLDHCLAAPDLDVFGTIRTPDNRYDVKAALTPQAPGPGHLPAQKPGEGILFDARLFHRGGRNATAADRRSLLSVSLQAGGGDAASPAAHAGTTDSIFAAYRDKYRLGDIAAAEA
ncbi:hypothetical protein JL722_12222 [Aureococcus anophagefferens]|nr:hypothetical protein JL722_12222 [Aureococcus anophagefferens]